jgi:hypothetical protein
MKEARIVRFGGHLYRRGGLVLNDRICAPEVTNPRTSIDLVPEVFAP